MPKTRLGKWSARLFVVFLLLLILRQVNPFSRRTLDSLMLQLHPYNKVLILTTMALGICGIAVFFTSITSVIKKGERSVFVFLAILAVIVAAIVLIAPTLRVKCRNETGISKTLSFGPEVTETDLEEMLDSLKIKNGRISSQRVKGENGVSFILLDKPEGEKEKEKRKDEKMLLALKETIDSGKMKSWERTGFGDPKMFSVYFHNKPEESEIAEIKEVVENNSNYYLERLSQSEANEYLLLELSLTYDTERSCGWPLLQEFEKTESMIRNYPGIKIKEVRSNSWYSGGLL